jgi:hypothetical protein
MGYVVEYLTTVGDENVRFNIYSDVRRQDYTVADTAVIGNVDMARTFGTNDAAHDGMAVADKIDPPGIRAEISKLRHACHRPQRIPNFFASPCCGSSGGKWPNRSGAGKVVSSAGA